MDANTTYTATLKFVSTGADPNAMHIMYEWDPPFDVTLAEVKGDPDELPFSYQHMAYLLQSTILPRVAMSERYEEEFLDEPTIADVLDELNEGTVH